MKRNIDPLKRDVQNLALPQGRMVGSPGHQRVRNYLQERLTELSLSAYRSDSFCLPYERDGIRFHNLIGVASGRDQQAAPILIGAHYDSVLPAPCADDNAAAVAIALFVAEQLKRHNVRRDVVIGLFDAEEPPHFQTPSMGSIRFYEDERDERGFHAAAIMDLVGHDVVIPAEYLHINRWIDPILQRFPTWFQGDVALPIVRDFVFLTGAESHPAIASVIGQWGRIRRLRPMAILNKYIGDMSDHGVFRHHGVPYLFLSCGRWPHYHTVTDTPDRLNYRKMQRIAELLLRFIREVDQVDLSTEIKPLDTIELEIRTIRKAFGPLFRPMMTWTRVPHLETRKDLDQLVGALLSTGL